MIEQSEAYREQRISKAEGDVARFNQIYSEYRKDEETTKTRISRKNGINSTQGLRKLLVQTLQVVH